MNDYYIFTGTLPKIVNLLAYYQFILIFFYFVKGTVPINDLQVSVLLSNETFMS
eukprot:GAHX01006154.1.p3 GENE.GAHX01006154.1~~GAHX01006154.1.p3  ORF type:complete len:54 (+),score=1.89 GAHX01006154.1:1168-1329(+)